MPISKEKRQLYASNWDDIAFSVKTKADWICQGCDRPCRRPDETLDILKYRLAHKSKELYLECCRKPGLFVLTTAHLDHDPGNNSLSNLKALCPKCHLQYDAKLHAKNAAITRAKKKAEPAEATKKKKTVKAKTKPARRTKSTLIIG